MNALAAPERRQLRHRRFRFLAVAGRDDDSGARFRQALGHAEPDAAIAAGDDRDAPGKIERLHDTSPRGAAPASAERIILRQPPRLGNRAGLGARRPAAGRVAPPLAVSTAIRDMPPGGSRDSMNWATCSSRNGGDARRAIARPRSQRSGS